MRFEGDEVQKHIDLTYSLLKKGFLFLLESSLHNKFISLIFDGLKKEEGKSKIGDYHYIPLLFYESYNIRKNQRLLLELYGLFLNEIQGRAPSFGVIYCGRECRIRKIHLSHQNKSFVADADAQHIQPMRTDVAGSHRPGHRFGQGELKWLIPISRLSGHSGKYSTLALISLYGTGKLGGDITVFSMTSTNFWANGQPCIRIMVLLK